MGGLLNERALPVREQMKKKSDEYRVRARGCFKQASELRDPELKRQFKEAAEHWVQMADQMDRFGLVVPW